MATVFGVPASYRPEYSPDGNEMATFRDPRSPNDEFPSPVKSTNRESSSQPDLNMEVATLSQKLISAINHQTHLDDALAATRLELETSQKKALKLEEENQEHRTLLASGNLVKRSELELLQTQVAEEGRKRQLVEKEKTSIETELENLSAALFQEANQVWRLLSNCSGN